MVERNFNIHDVLKFKIICENKFLWRFNNILSYFQNFETPIVENAALIVYLGKFEPANKECYISENKYYIKEDYFYCKYDSYKFTEWEFEISGLSKDCTIVHISSNSLGYLWMVGFIIDFLISYKLNERGYSIMHASSISDGNYGFLFSGRGGSGKTTIALNLLEVGYKMLGDNFSIIGKDTIFGYTTPLNLFKYNLHNIIKRNMTLSQKLEFIIKDIIYKVSLGYIKIFTKINPKYLFPKHIENQARLKSIFVLYPRNTFNIKSFSKSDLCNFIYNNQKMEYLAFLPYIMEYSYIYPDSKLANYWKDYYEVLYRNISDNVVLYRVEVPKKYDLNIFKELIKKF